MRLGQGPLLMMGSHCLFVQGESGLGSVNPGTTVPHLLAIQFNQLTETLYVCLCETSTFSVLS